MPVVLELVVPGLPQQQGSKNPWGGDANKNLKPWRAGVQDAARRAYDGKQLLREGVIVTARFIYPRPKGHYRTGRNAHLLRDNAPAYKSSAPDLDKLQRALGDSLTGVVIHDDALIARWSSEKIYGPFAETHIVVRTLE